MYHKKIKTKFLFFYASVDGIKNQSFLIKIMQSIIFTRHTVRRYLERVKNEFIICYLTLNT